MSISASVEGNQCVITILDRFDFSTQNEFRKAYEAADPGSHFVLDFSGADYMDSSALGMLLLLRDYAGGDHANIELRHCKPEIKNILEISNFQKLFKLS